MATETRMVKLVTAAVPAVVVSVAGSVVAIPPVAAPPVVAFVAGSVAAVFVHSSTHL